MQSLAQDSQLALSDQLNPVADVAKRLIGKRPSPPTIWRWIRRGVCSGEVRLRASCLSGKWYCTEEDFRDFIARQTEHALADDSGDDPETEAQLQAAGLLD